MAQDESPTIQVEETHHSAHHAERAQTSPLGRAPGRPSQYPVPQSPSQESDDGSSENSDDGPKEAHREKEKVDPHVLPQFDWEGLETEYYAAMSRANDVEANLNEEFKALAN
ncbi:hypothetical protein VE04_09553, partial [Pseudogymnoascus sp. 24MN13]